MNYLNFPIYKIRRSDDYLIREFIFKTQNA